jgi:TPR repeat protein
MLGDCLLDGVGVERDRSEALEWLITSAELGHRGARSRVLAVLEMDPNKCEDYHGFTDSSRQSLATAWTNGKLSSSTKAVSADKSHINPFDHGKTRDGLEMQYSNRPVNIERRYTIGGGKSSLSHQNIFYIILKSHGFLLTNIYLGARNPKVLKRRETIVKESRQGDLG